MLTDVLKKIDGLFITNPTNIRYMTGFVGVAADEREAFVLIAKDKTYLFTNGLYQETAKQLTNSQSNKLTNTTISFVEISRENPISKELARITYEQGIKTLGFEDDNLTVAEFTKLKQVLTDIELIPEHNRIEELRMIKNKNEIENIKLAATITDKCFKFLTKRIRPGMTESRLANEIEGLFKYQGAENAFPPIVAFNEHSSQPHYPSTGNSPLRKGSLVLLDFGAKVNGYCADMTRVVFIGQPKPEWIKAYDAVLAANQKALDLLADGERHGATLDAAAKEVIAEADLPTYPHSLGHAVGLDIHEAPRLNTHKDELLKPNMVVSVEPGVYIEGQYGIRIEDLVHINQNKIEILSKSPKDLTVI